MNLFDKENFLESSILERPSEFDEILAQSESRAEQDLGELLFAVKDELGETND